MARSLALVVAATGACLITGIDNGLGVHPPRGWRSWNQFQCAINQTRIEGQMDVMASRSRTVGGKPTSLIDLGFADAGIDDCWQKCGAYGPNNYTYHDATGAPVVNTDAFPSLKGMTDHAHSLGLSAGWYGNNCACKDHCSDLSCFQGDVAAVIEYGFDSIKLDGCGKEENVQLWSELLNATGKAVVIENCHNGPNVPYYFPNGTLWCPFNWYRSSTDIRPTYGSVMTNLQSVIPLQKGGLTLPGCWAYPDMLEVGVTNTQSAIPPLTLAQARSHFGAWVVVSSPLVLGMDLTDAATLDAVWPFLSNPRALAVSYDISSYSVLPAPQVAGMFAESGTFVQYWNCGWWIDQCSLPSWQLWYKSVANATQVAVLLMNHANSTQRISLDPATIPGWSCPAGGCAFYDIWQQAPIGTFTSFAPQVPAQDTSFVLISKP